MKGRDFRRLARLSLKSHKKTTIQTIVGVSFGMILLFPLLFIALGFYVGFNIEVNKNASYRTFNITYNDVKTSDPTVNACFVDYQKDIDAIGGISKKTNYSYYSFNEGTAFSPSTYTIKYVEKDPWGEEKEIVKTDSFAVGNRNERYIGISVIDASIADDPFIQNDYDINKMALMSGTAFTKGNSKGEIMVSSAFANLCGLHYYELVGATISLEVKTDTNSKTPASTSATEIISTFDTDISLPYFREFKIVGIYSSMIYKDGNARDKTTIPVNEGSSFYSRKPYFWITTDSIDPNGHSYPQTIDKEYKDEYGNVTYKQSWFYYEDEPINIANSITSDGYAFIPFGLGVYNNPHYAKSEIIEFNNFGSSRSAYELINEFYKKSSTKESTNVSVTSSYVPNGFIQYLTFYDVFLYVCLGLGAFGGVIFIATLLNLINTLHFSVESSKGFLGICRAEGLRSKGVIRLFLNQIYWIFFYGYIFTIVFGGGICVGVKLLFDNLVQSSFKDLTSLKFTIEWYYIPISLGVLVVITTLLSIIFSHLLAGKVSKTPILDILTEENK